MIRKSNLPRASGSAPDAQSLRRAQHGDALNLRLPLAVLRLDDSASPKRVVFLNCKYRSNKEAKMTTDDTIKRGMPSKLSDAQLYALHVGIHFKLKRSSMGWWADGHPSNTHNSVRIISPATIKSLWRMGLLDGVHEQTVTAELCTNERGRELLNQISQDTGLFYDRSKDTLVYPSAPEDDEGHQIIYH
jgi:hypothetical protein